MYERKQRQSEKYIAVKTFHLGDLERSIHKGDVIWWDGNAADFGDGTPVAYSKLRLAVNARWLMKADEYERLHQARARTQAQAQPPQRTAQASYNAGGGAFSQPEVRGNYSSNMVDQKQANPYGIQVTHSDNNIVGTLEEFSPNGIVTPKQSQRVRKSGNTNNNILRVASHNPDNTEVHLNHAIAFGKDSEIFTPDSVIPIPNNTQDYQAAIQESQQGHTPSVEILGGDQVVLGSIDDFQRPGPRLSYEEAQARLVKATEGDDRFHSYRRDVPPEFGGEEAPAPAQVRMAPRAAEPHGAEPYDGTITPKNPDSSNAQKRVHTASIRTAKRPFEWDKSRHWKTRVKDIIENYSEDPELLAHILSLETEGVKKHVRAKLGL